MLSLQKWHNATIWDNSGKQIRVSYLKYHNIIFLNGCRDWQVESNMPPKLVQSWGHYEWNLLLGKRQWGQIYEPRREISNNVVCATSKASDQPAHTRSLIRAFASRMNILWALSYWPNIFELLNLKGGCTGSSESTLVKMPHSVNHMSRLNYCFLVIVILRVLPIIAEYFRTERSKIMFLILLLKCCQISENKHSFFR